MKLFSQRQGIKPIIEGVQIGAMNEELRNSLWNALDKALWSADGFVNGQSGYIAEIEKFSRALWDQHLKKPVDSRPGRGMSHRGRLILDQIREYFFNFEWHEVYDFLEFVVRHCNREPD